MDMVVSTLPTSRIGRNFQPGCAMFFKSRKGMEPGNGAPEASAGLPPDVAPKTNGALSASNAPASVASIPPAIALSREEQQRRADYSHGVMQAFGSIVAVYMRSKVHRALRLADIEMFVGPAVTTGQFSLAEATHKQNGLVTPVAVVLWASVSDAVDARISAAPQQPLSLVAADWKSGDTIWIVEAIGDQKMIGTMLQRLQATQWKGRTVKMRAHGEGGWVVTQVLPSRHKPGA